MITEQFKLRDFQILSDSNVGCKPMNGICQFLYKEKQISISTVGLFVGFQQEINIYGFDNDKGDYTALMHQTRTVEEAIRFIDLMEIVSKMEEVELSRIISVLNRISS